MSKVKICFVGCGGIANYHMSHLRLLNDLEYIGFCDLIEERAQRFVDMVGQGKVYTDFRKMYEECTPDLLYICIPPSKHGDVELEAIKFKFNIFVEKPVTMDLDLAIKIRDAIAEAGIISGVGFQMRYETTAPKMQEYVAGHELGIVSCTRVGGVPGVDWWRKMELSGGQLVEQTIHQFDILRMLLGDADTVYTVTRRDLITEKEWPGYNVDDYSMTVATFKNGKVATIASACYALSDDAYNSNIIFSSRSSRMEYYMGGKIDIIENGKTTTIPAQGDPGFTADCTLINAVKTNNQSLLKSSYADAVKTLAFTLACNESAKTGKPVKVNI